MTADAIRIDGHFPDECISCPTEQPHWFCPPRPATPLAPLLADYFDHKAERRAEDRNEPMSGPECDRVADFDAIKRGAA